MLQGKSIWITRPQGQADSLVTALESAGARVRQLPMLAIEPLEISQEIKARILDLDNYELLFFISTNAANLGMALIHDYWPQFPVGLRLYAVGPTTADVIEGFGQKAEYPTTRMSSEALLALDSLADIRDRKALIVRGVGGRELLADALRERGASVDYLELYRRICPGYGKGELAAAWRGDCPAAVVVTSAEALANLAGVLERDGLPPGQVPLYVSSDRIAKNAAELGFRETITMPGADDKAIIASLEDSF